MVLADVHLGFVFSHKLAVVILLVLPWAISNKVVEVAAIVAALWMITSWLVLSPKRSQGPLLGAVAPESP